MTRENQGKVALVTGGAQGIGLGVSHTFAGAGYHVVLVDRDEEAGQEALTSLAGASHASSSRKDGENSAGHSDDALQKSHFVHANVAEEDEVKRVARWVHESFGRLDVLVNNAGIGSSMSIKDRSMEEWDYVLSVNLRAPYMMTKYLLPLLENANPGVIVNIASTRALMSEANTEPYSASKGGILALTHSLAVSLGPKVLVNAISPGWIEVGDWKKSGSRIPVSHSDMDNAQHPAGRVGTPLDIAEMALFLASPKARFITGQNFGDDGGMTIKMIYEE